MKLTPMFVDALVRWGLLCRDCHPRPCDCPMSVRPRGGTVGMRRAPDSTGKAPVPPPPALVAAGGHRTPDAARDALRTLLVELEDLERVQVEEGVAIGVRAALTLAKLHAHRAGVA